MENISITDKLQYNSAAEPLVIPEYGRNVQNLISNAMQEQDTELRQKKAERIVSLMAQISEGTTKPSSDVRDKIWKHLFYIADYKIDVLPPSGVKPVRDELTISKRSDMSYPERIRNFRHYGRYVQILIDKAATEEDEEKRRAFLTIIASYMKLAYRIWNQDPFVGNEVIVDDLKILCKNKIEVPDDIELINLVNKVTISKNKINKRKKNGSKNNQSRNNNNRRRR